MQGPIDDNLTTGLYLKLHKTVVENKLKKDRLFVVERSSRKNLLYYPSVV